MGVSCARYAASPQCVPSRTTMFAGRHIHKTKTWNNDQGFAAAPDGTLDQACLKFYDQQHCTTLAANQSLKGTITGELEALGCMSCIFGKVDVGVRVPRKHHQHTYTSDKRTSPHAYTFAIPI